MLKETEIELETSQLKALYSKKAVGIFSVFFSAIFGAILLMYNLRKLKNPKGSIVVLAFGIGYTMVASIILAIVNVNTNIAILLNLGGAYLLTTFFWNKYIGKEYEYNPKKYKLPLILLLLVTLFILFYIYGHLVIFMVVSFFNSLIH